MEEQIIKSKKKKRTLIIIIIVITILLIFFGIKYGMKKYKENFNEVIITNNEVLRSSDKIYTLNEKISNLIIKLKTKESIAHTNIKIYSGNLVLFEQSFNSAKRWKVNIDKLSLGMNIIDVTIKYQNGEERYETLYLYNKSKKNLGTLDKKDDDLDELLNYQEEISGTDKGKFDTDGDGLSDYYEIYHTLTSPIIADSDENNILDGQEDNDSDGLTNILESKYKTSPNQEDSDLDGIGDKNEINIYKTNPLKVDSDLDGLNDYEEILLKYDPLKQNKTFNVQKKSSDNKATVKINNISGSQYQSLNITAGNNKMIDKSDKGYVSGPYNITMDGEFESATIIIQVDNKVKNPTIYYLNSENDSIEEVKTIRNGNTVMATLKHFSEYIVLDKEYIDSIKNSAIKIDGSNIDNSLLSNKEYIVIAFPIASLLANQPLYVYEIDGKLETLENYQQNYNDLLSKDKNINISVVFKKISKLGSVILDTLFGWFEKFMADTYKSATDSDDYQSIFQYLVIYKHIYGNEDLELFLFEEDKNIIVDDSNIITKDKEKDSNKDGISDFHTKLICEGLLTTRYGLNPFGDISYNDIQKSKDYDNDKLKNGEEITIVEENGRYFVEEKSSPIKKDTDEDTVNDNKDASPKEKFNKNFISVSNYNYISKTPIEDELEIKSNSLYNTTTGEYKGILNRAQLQVSMFGQMPAALALGHFLENDTTNKSYNFNNDWSLLEKTYRGKEGLAKNTNMLMDVVENTVKNNEKLYFATQEELTGTAFGSKLEDITDIGWWYAIGHTRAIITAEAKNKDDYNYEMKVKYNIVDFYDWENNNLLNGGFGGMVTDAEMYKLHTYGVAKQYRINISYEMKITWKKGDRWYLNEIWLYDMPATMKLTKID